MATLVLAAAATALLAVLAAAVAAVYHMLATWRRPDDLDLLGVRPTYPGRVLPDSKIEAYRELKESLRKKHVGTNADDRWMSQLPLQAKDMLKYRLMQRAIGDMASLQKLDADARGYWRLFAKGIITKTFWSSVVEAEKELSLELEAVKAEAVGVEPGQDPQGIISEAMQFVLRFGDRLPSAAEIANGADAINDLMRYLPPPGHPALGGPPPSQGHPALAGLGGVGGPPAGGTQEGAGGAGEGAYSWRQEGDELEVAVSVPKSATKAQVKVLFQPRSLRVELAGEVLAEGRLAGTCRPEGSTWTLGGGRLVVTLEKMDPRPWPGLFAAKA